MNAKATQTTKERPIIFGAESIKAIIEGRKTQTRRVVKWKQRKEGLNLSASSLSLGFYYTGVPSSGYVLSSRDGRGVWNDRTYPIHCPYGKVGDRLWVREAWGDVTLAFQSHQCEDPQVIAFKADASVHEANNMIYLEKMDDSGIVCREWRNPLFMPRRYARIILEITEVRVERLQEMTYADLMAEGVEDKCGYYCSEDVGHVDHAGNWNVFIEIWNELNEKRGYPFDSNPWVWAISFKPISVNQSNISSVLLKDTTARNVTEAGSTTTTG